MSTINIKSKTIWSRSPKATGLSRVTENNGTRPYYLSYADGRVIAEVFHSVLNPEDVGIKKLRIKLFSVGPMNEVKHLTLKRAFLLSELSEAKKYASDSYKDIATLDKYAH